MDTTYSKRIESFQKNLGIYQIIGGAVGLALVAWTLISSQEPTAAVFIITLFMSLFFGFSIHCGLLCYRKKDNALKMSFRNQLLQIIGFAIFGWGFRYAAGIFLSLGLDFSDPSI